MIRGCIGEETTVANEDREQRVSSLNSVCLRFCMAMSANIRCERAASAIRRRQLSDACLAVCYSHSSMDLQSGATLCAHHRCSSFGPWQLRTAYPRRSWCRIESKLTRYDADHPPAQLAAVEWPRCIDQRSRKERRGGAGRQYLPACLAPRAPFSRGDKSARGAKASRMSVENAADLQTIRRASMMVAILGRCASGFSRRDSPSPSSDHHVNIARSREAAQRMRRMRTSPVSAEATTNRSLPRATATAEQRLSCQCLLLLLKTGTRTWHGG